MKVLVIGSGGREHTLVWKLNQSPQVDKIFTAPGNAGTAQLSENVDIEDNDVEELVEFATEEEVDLTFVGPEAPLVAGIVDRFREEGLKVFGPNKEAAKLEGSKVFSKNLMAKYDIPTAKYDAFIEVDNAITYIKEVGAPIVVKAEGLAAGKGVIIAETEEEAIEAVETIMLDKKFGQAGERVVIEEYLDGEEATVLAFTDGETIVPMLSSQDHKQAYDNDEGPNTGGMGAYAPAPVVTDKVLQKAYDEILVPTIEALQQEGIKYKGILYAGLMIEDNEPKVLEYNVRFGDPEAQPVLSLLETDLVEIAEAVIAEDLASVEVEWSDKTAVCVIMASGGYPIDYETGKEITGIKETEADGTTVFQAGTEVKNDKLVTAGGRVLGVTALGDDYQETINKAYQGIEKIEFEDAEYRTDIGQKALNHK
ncbi:phosphoribosylamine--glycine ligase [Acetohalobium arabaticum]|uniref:Phosphoribosylamine--glycine ligase n=1 Tax=Acetohalobium arabaticum (strain ATCC 49924 / DSM 5501 / Z-7288) TaxID=574087 RepID=D9QUK2_ACEAZ|nr:phosphoribosylamine--glycine ligase [Acetohalobium arabaticum]ADL13803.1 phosphoribosylamine--glycine ligase [Acetohalobium arabaticum DSM 5501]